MNVQLIQIAVPVAMLLGLAAFFLVMAKQTASADRARCQRARHLTGTMRDAVLGSVGWRSEDGLATDFACGLVSAEVGGKTVVARQARLTEDTISAI